MRTLTLTFAGLLLLGSAAAAHAGCTGPTIMGVCYGASTEYDTHGDGQIRPSAPPGFFFDKRGTADEENFPGAIDPFTGRDAHDSNWGNTPQRQGIQDIPGW